MHRDDLTAPSAGATAATSAASTSADGRVLSVLDALDELEDLIESVTGAVHDARQALGVAIDVLEHSAFVLMHFRERER